MLKRIFGQSMGTSGQYKFDRKRVYVREHYLWKEYKYFVPEQKHDKVLRFIEQKLKFQLTQDIFQKDDAFIQVVYEHNYLRLRFGTKDPESLIKLEHSLEQLLTKPTPPLTKTL